MQRYDIECDYLGGRMVKDDSGDYVLVRDAEAELAALRAKVAELSAPSPVGGEE